MTSFHRLMLSNLLMNFDTFLYFHLISSIKIISKWPQRTPIKSCFISPVSRARVRDVGSGGVMVAFVHFFICLVFFSVLHKHNVLFNIIYGNLFINCNRKKERRHRLCDVKRICLFRRRRRCFSIKSRPRESWSMHAMMTPLTSSSSPRSRQKSWRLQSVFRHGRGAMPTECDEKKFKKKIRKQKNIIQAFAFAATLCLHAVYVICNCFHLRSPQSNADCLFVPFLLLFLFANGDSSQDSHAIIWTYSPFKSWRKRKKCIWN